MRFNIRAGALVAAAGALAVAVPAAAADGHSHSTSADHPSHPAQSHKCKPHNVAYVESGNVAAGDGSTLAKNADGTWTGALVVDVTRTNHAAKGDANKTVNYSFTNAKLRVRFDGGTTAFTPGERVTLIGKLARVGKKCTAMDPAPAPVFRMVVVHPAASSTSS